MSREIKFRAWHKKRSEMMRVVDIYFGRGEGIQATRLLAVHDGMKYSTNEQTLNDVELMQYTGLRDKGGAEIYEGDIIRVNVVDNKDLEAEYRSTHLVEWCSGDDYPAFDLFPAWDDQLNSFSSILNTNCFEMEVIGNIHENPELLEVK